MNGSFDAHNVLLGLVLLNAAAAIFLLILQSLPTFQRKHNAPSSDMTRNQGYQSARPTDLFFSVHVPTHNEPPEIVIETLEHLAKLESDAFEVIVLDNNTKDPAAWRPVQQACARLGARFRFYHRDNVEGAKAGALNIAATLASPRATHFVILDADYQVTPDFISVAISAIKSSGADFVQFPQAYRDQMRAPSVATELADYFLNVAPHTNRARAMLLTGTLSVIDRKAIDAVGGWSGATITEDAELGVRLYLAQHRGVYVHKTVGRGMLPLDFEGLAKQRNRWVAGNVQTLIASVQAGLVPVTRPALAIWAQLTAWVNLFAFPAFALIFLALFPSNNDVAAATSLMAGLTILGAIAVGGLRLARSAGQQPFQAVAWLRVCRVKLALSWSASLAWLPVFLGKKLDFQRTLKSRSADVSSWFPGLAVISAIMGCVSVFYMLHGQIVAAVASAILSQCWFAARSVDRELKGSSRKDFRGNSPCSA